MQLNYIFETKIKLKSLESISIILFVSVILSPVIVYTLFNKKQKSNHSTSGQITRLVAFISFILASVFINIIEINIVLSVFWIILSVFIIRKNFYNQSILKDRVGLEILFISVSFIVLNIFFFNNARWIIVPSLMISFLAGSLAKIFGMYFPIKNFNVTSDVKSIGGSLAFFTSAIAAILFLSANFSNYYLNTEVLFSSYLISVAVLVAFILTVFEVILSEGLDNLFVPVFCGFLLYVFLQAQDSALLLSFSLGAAIAFIIVVLSYYVKFLTISGSTATFLLASFIFGFGGLKWSVPIMAFFILSSLLSKIRKKVNDEVEKYFEKTGVRDHWQVVANGGIGGILVIINLIYPSELFYFIYVSSLAAVCADTWATEIGTMYKTKTYNILTFKQVDQGLSGGISLVGTLGGMLGAMIIAFSGLYWIEINNVYFVLFIIVSGVAGSSFDSVLGATIQAQFECVICGKLTEKEFHCNKITMHKKGFNWLNNDLVNLLAGIGGGIFILIFKGLLS